MSTTSNKKKSDYPFSKKQVIIISSVIVAVVIAIVVLALLFAGKGVKPIENATWAKAEGSYMESWSYNMTKDETMKTLLEQYNSLTYRETANETIDLYTDVSVYRVTFYDGDDEVGYFAVNKDNKCMFSVDGKVCTILSGFDYYKFSDAIEKEIAEEKFYNGQ